MYKPDYLIVDPICTFVFSILVMFTTIPTFVKCIGILMEQTPEEVATDKLKADLLKISHVNKIEDFHCWALAGDKYIMSAILETDLKDTEGFSEAKKINQKC